jgi:chromosome segregation ATPase
MLTAVFVLTALLSSFQAQDNDFQSYYAKVSKAAGKTPETLTKADVDILKDAASKNDTYFGDAYQNSMKTIKQSAKRKITEYDEYIKRKAQIESEFKEKEKKIAQTEGELRETEAERDSAIALSEQLRIEIDKLNKRMNKLSNEKGSLEKMNKKLQEDNQSYSTMLDDARKVMSRVQNILVGSPMSNEVSANMPQTLKDSLESIECGVAETLMNNFTLTIESMQKDEKLMDSISKIYKETKTLPQDIEEYLENGRKLSEKMASSQSDCVRISGNSIVNSIEEFKSAVENYSQKKSIFDMLLIPGLIAVVALLVVIILLLRRKKI